ncbi:neural cell adhesion molecule 1 isoform X1 [Hippoglossus stenolepis]|uniref:neural cell adhesion molecule 1 isoform X1 n=1 Tax=Hippoglossus stenolepis TaxID=195615 RepID=UPI001FAF020E|nr:neural cell adhesion molecule 1 isoform X1 [Hippoglossus stenolepis]
MTNPSALLRLASLLLLLVCGTDAEIQIIPNKIDVLVGGDTLLLCKAGGEADITWQKDGEDIEEEKVTKIDETSSKLIIKNVTIQNTGKYTCVCEFESGHNDKVQAQLFVYEGPSFGGTTIYHEFLEGTNGVVPCLATGRPAVDIQWIRNTQEIPSKEGGRLRRLPDNTLHIEKVRREDAGTYVCQAQIRGRTIYQQLSVSVVINAPPKVHLREEVKKVMAGSETNESLLCLVDGHPKPNITWTMPLSLDPFRHQFNSDRSQLTIRAVARADFGEYICTAANKIGEDRATIMLHVFEAPEVFVSAVQQSVSGGERASVSCNVSGHPQPELHWLNKNNGQTLDSTSGRIHVVDGVLLIDDMMPSDGGTYSCMAVSISRNASRDVKIYTQPGLPHYLSVSPGPTSVFFSLKTLPISGGMPITSFALQWRQSSAEKWNEVTLPASDPLAVTALKPYTLYTVRLAALNAAGLGQFSDPNSVRTQGIREPDSPVLSLNEIKVKGNTFSTPLKQIDDGGVPLLHFIIRYKQDKEGAEWKEMQLPSTTDTVSLKDLSFGSDYQLEVTAVNTNGSSIPATLNFTIAEKPPSSRTMTILMTIAVKLFGHQVPGLKMLEEGSGSTNGDVTLKGMSTPRGSMQQVGVQTITKEGGQLTEVTCDKAPLTKNEKTHPDRNQSAADA